MKVWCEPTAWAATRDSQQTTLLKEAEGAAMTAIATRRTKKLAAKLHIGTAACALAAAAVLTPLPAAQADPVAPIPLASSLGSVGGSAGGGAALIAVCDPATSGDCVVPTANATFSLPGGNTILQNPLWWFGQPNTSPPTQTPVFTFYPLNLLPGFLRPLFSWFADINYEACVLGFRLHIGPYGAVSGSYSRGCA
jgi:hypothetical protein